MVKDQDKILIFTFMLNDAVQLYDHVISLYDY